MAFQLALSSHREAWSKSLERDAGMLHCSNPRCVHLFEHNYKKGGDHPEFRDRKCETFVWVDVQGRPEKRYRFQQGDHIHVACQGRFCRDENKRKITFCHLVCGECMNATPVPAHLGMGGECRACLAETRDRKVTGSSEGIRGGPRDKFAEEANENSYKDAKRLEDADEEENAKEQVRKREELQNGATGGVAQRRAAMAKLQAKRAKAAAASSAAADELAQAQERLDAYKEGKTFVGDEEADANVDLKDEDVDQALAFWQEECDYDDILKMRDHFPQCALMWWGPVPTAEAIEEQQTKVEALMQAAETAKTSYELVLREAQDDDEPPVDGGAAVDYDEPQAEPAAGAGAANALEAEAAAEAQPAAAAAAAAENNNNNDDQNRRRPRKALRVDEMNEQQLAKHRADRAKQANTRREKEANRKKMEAEYPDLVERASKYDRAKKKIAQKNELIQSFQAELEEKDKRIEAEQDKVTMEIDGFIAFLNDKNGKPAGWNPDSMIQNYQMQRARREAKAAVNGKRKRDAPLDAE